MGTSYTSVERVDTGEEDAVKRLVFLLVCAGFFCTFGCGATTDGVTAETVEPAVDVPKEAGPVPSLLDHPFTAEQIRDEWIEGFRLRVRQWTPETEAVQVWTVVRADADTVDIESIEEGDEDGAEGEGRIQTSSWARLRDHASFPADRATREMVSRETPLGDLRGWLYTVTDPKGGLVTEFFFAEAMPGAPVFVHVLRDGEVVEIFEQIERSRPSADGDQ